MKSQENLILEIRNNWFKNHVAEFSDFPNNPNIKTLTWQQPNTSIYSIHYCIWGRNLAVFGDLGEAIYSWSSNVDWDFLSSCNLDYFHGKCRASECGSSFNYWEPDEVLKWWDEQIEQRAYEIYENQATPDNPQWKDIPQQKRKKLILESKETFNNTFDPYSKHPPFYSKDEFVMFLYDHHNELLESGIDPCDMGSVGEVINPRCVSHWLGIRMAVEQKRAESKTRPYTQNS